MIVGYLVFVINIVQTYLSSRSAPRKRPSQPPDRRRYSPWNSAFRPEDLLPMLESKAGALFIAGIGFFALAFLSNALVPALMYRDLPEQTVEQLLRNNGNLRFQFEDLARRFPDSFTAAYGRPPENASKREKWLDKKSQEASATGPRCLRGRGLLALP